MKVRITYALPQRQISITIDLPDGSTISDAIKRSGILERFPAIDMEKQKVGIFGKFVKLDAAVEDGDRIEIYRPLTVDPKTVPKRAKRDREAAEPAEG